MVDLDALRASVLSEQAEEAGELLMLCAAEHAKVRMATSGWMFDSKDGSSTALSYVMRCVILVEVFTFRRIVDLSDIHAGTVVSPVFDHLYKAHRSQIDRSWNNAIQALELWPGSVGVRSYSEFPALEGFILARNSWAHGHGRLTTQQLRERKKTGDLVAAAGLKIVDGYVTVRPEQVIDVARTCRDFIRRVDRGTKEYLP